MGLLSWPAPVAHLNVHSAVTVLIKSVPAGQEVPTNKKSSKKCVTREDLAMNLAWNSEKVLNFSSKAQDMEQAIG